MNHIDIYTEHLEFLNDQYRLICDTLTDEEKSQPVFSKKLKRIEFKIFELKCLIDTEKERINSQN